MTKVEVNELINLANDLLLDRELGIICLCRADYFHQREVKEYLKWHNYREVHRELMAAWDRTYGGIE